MKEFKGKAIYQPAGAAAEYSKWACNFFVGCSNNCQYCFLKKGIGAKVLGRQVPALKKCFKSESHAFEVFEKELKSNLTELQKHGLLFSFTTDPMLKETIGLTLEAAIICNDNDIPIKILTKRSDWVDGFLKYGFGNEKLYAFGFTLTGHDELELGASTNLERIKAMEQLHDAGFKTFASIEPIIDIKSSLEMIERISDHVDLVKIGLLSGKTYLYKDLIVMAKVIIDSAKNHDYKIYFKDSFLKQSTITREELSVFSDKCVGSDYNMFEGRDVK